MDKISELLHTYCTEHHLSEEDFYQLVCMETTTQPDWRFGDFPEPDLLLCFWEVTGIPLKRLQQALEYDQATLYYELAAAHLAQIKQDLEQQERDYFCNL